MKVFFRISVIAMFASACWAAAVHSDEVMETVVKSLQSDIKRKGCNANVCFAVDGSGSVSADEFKIALEFVQSVTNALAFSPDTEYAALQFGKVSYPISRLTANSREFSTRVEGTDYIGDSRTSVGSGIVTCDAVLASRPGQPNKIVTITDGRNNFGGDPITNANLFRERNPNGRICSVAVGSRPDDRTLTAIAGSNGSVLTVTQYIKLGQIIEKLVKDICSL